MTYVKQRKGCRMSCYLGESTESLENEQSYIQWSRAHSPNFLSLHLRHSSFNTSVALPTSQLILQPFRCFTYVTVHSPTLLSLLLRHRLFSYVTWRASHATDIIWRKGTPFEAMTGRATKCPLDGFLTEVFRGSPQS